jgi:hypothetical protein
VHVSPSMQENCNYTHVRDVLPSAGVLVNYCKLKSAVARPDAVLFAEIKRNIILRF